jgi:monofunctional biosynthetic peptidoglycan transglycosylase
LITRLFRRILKATLVLLLLMTGYTVYCFFFLQPDLCKLRKVNPRTTAFIEMRKRQWGEKKLKRRIDQRWVAVAGISQHLKDAVVCAEDPYFYRHHGLDFHQIRLAMEENWEEKRIVRGASTITQQLMKNLYLSPSQNPLRKWKEAILAVRVEACLSKPRILELYLNLIEWGESTYGVQAAARKYFDKNASALDPAESALLAAMIPNPVKRNPYHQSPKLIRKKNLILKLMWKSGKLSTLEYQSALNERIRLR